MRSSSATVERRWAMTREVRPCMSFLRASWIRRSLSESRAEVASSRTRIGASLRIARAMAMRWRWPPESLTPRSPVRVSRPLGRVSMNSQALASLAARVTSASVASGLA